MKQICKQEQAENENIKHQCDQCKYETEWISNLKRHKDRIHQEQKFCCDICGKKYIQKTHLKEHKRTHTGEKPFKCENCNKCFATKRSLIQHMKGYENGVYPCKKCKKRFRLLKYLKKHESIHLVKNHISCENCHKSFASKAAENTSRVFLCMSGTEFLISYALSTSGSKSFLSFCLLNGFFDI